MTVSTLALYCCFAFILYYSSSIHVSELSNTESHHFWHFCVHLSTSRVKVKVFGL